jgi:hypothetical protein
MPPGRDRLNPGTPPAVFATAPVPAAGGAPSPVPGTWREETEDAGHGPDTSGDRRRVPGRRVRGSLLPGPERATRHGQQRRIAIARALLRDTPVLLLDEPTAGPAAATESLLMGGLSASSCGKTVILVTYQARLAALADRVVTLERGVLTAFPGDPVAGATAAARSLARSSGQARRLVPCLAGGQP